MTRRSLPKALSTHFASPGRSSASGFGNLSISPGRQLLEQWVADPLARPSHSLTADLGSSPSARGHHRLHPGGRNPPRSEHRYSASCTLVVPRSGPCTTNAEALISGSDLHDCPLRAWRFSPLLAPPSAQVPALPLAWFTTLNPRLNTTWLFCSVFSFHRPGPVTWSTWHSPRPESQHGRWDNFPQRYFPQPARHWLLFFTGQLGVYAENPDSSPTGLRTSEVLVQRSSPFLGVASSPTEALWLTRYRHHHLGGSAGLFCDRLRHMLSHQLRIGIRFREILGGLNNRSSGTTVRWRALVPSHKGPYDTHQQLPALPASDLPLLFARVLITGPGGLSTCYRVAVPMRSFARTTQRSSASHPHTVHRQSV